MGGTLAGVRVLKRNTWIIYVVIFYHHNPRGCLPSEVIAEVLGRDSGQLEKYCLKVTQDCWAVLHSP